MPIALAAGAIGGSIIGGLFGKSAADTQAQAADNAAQLQSQEQQRALDFEEQQWNTQQANEAPWLKAGGQALQSLSALMGPGGQLSQGFNEQFQAPTAVTEQNDPGFQFRLQQGQDALERSAAARGGLLTGGMARGLTDYAQNDASQEYGNVYNRALQQYQQKYNIWRNNNTDLFNRYASLAGAGQQAAGQLGQFGANAGANVSNTLLGGGAQIGQDIQASAYQTGSGYAALGNAINSGITNAGQMYMLSGLMGANNGNGGGSTGAPNPNDPGYDPALYGG